MIRSVLGALASLSLLVACGGKVTFVAEKSGAGGAASTSTSTSTSTTTSNGTGGSVTSDCTTICGAVAFQNCAGNQGDCVATCVASSQMPACQAQYNAVLDCTAANTQFIVDCQPPSMCAQQAQAYAECTSMGESVAVSGSSGSASTGGGCVTNGCSGSNAGCECSGTCAGQSYDISCKIGNAGAVCACTLNGTTKMCSSESLTCDIGSSCCTGFFFPD